MRNSIHDEDANIPGIGDNHGVLRDKIALILVVVRDTMRDTEGSNRVPAQEFTDNGLGVWQRSTIRQTWETIVANDCIDLSLSLPLHVRELGHAEEERE